MLDSLIDKFQPRQGYLRVLWGRDKKNLSQYLNPDLINFSYVDKDADEADEICIDLKDEQGKWAGSWAPDAGMLIQAFIATGTPLRSGLELNCGTFFVDSIDFSGPPRTVSIRAVSIPLNKPIRRLVRSRAWQKQSLSAIAQTIARSADLELLFDSDEDPVFDRLDQSRETDMRFLKRVCSESGLSIKVTDSKLVLFEKSKYEKKAPIETITAGVSDVISFRFNQSHSEAYRSVTVKYRSPKLKKRGTAGGEMFDQYGRPVTNTSKSKGNPTIVAYTAVDQNVAEDGQAYDWKKRASSLSEAKRMAHAKLKELNSKSLTGDLQLVGDPKFVAGEVVLLQGFGSFDGSFYIDEASHNLGGSGFTTSLRVHRVQK